LLHTEGGWPNLRKPAAAALLLALFLSAGVAFLLRKPIIAVNYAYGGRWNPIQVIYHGEGVAHNVDIVRFLAAPKSFVAMMVNGTPEADTTYVQRRNFILKSHLPLLLHSDPQRVAVIGLGLGITLSAVNRYPDVRQIEVIELTREMVDAQPYLEDLSGGVLRSPKIHLRIDDGRNFMTMSDDHFDMITADPIHPRVTGVGYLYTKEYYESIKRRLSPHGIVCQWMPMYRISKRSFDVAFRTFASVFPNASFWYVRRNGLFVATQEPFQIDFAALRTHIQRPAVKSDMDSIQVHDASELLAHMLMGPGQISRYLAHSSVNELNTDDNAYLEYHTPFEFLEQTESIVGELLPYAELDLRDIYNISSQDRQAVIQSWNRRTAKLLSPDLDLDP
ncbi:MAG: hypothetical protein ACLQU2_20950, partial [Candidatus Binataceae bacterium]